MQQLASAVGECQLGAPELTGLGALHAATELVDHRLHAVTDAKHRDVELHELRAKGGGALRVHGGGPAREHERQRRALADAVEIGVVREHLGEDAALPDPPGDELGVLAAEVQDEHLLAGGARKAVGGLELGDGRGCGQFRIADRDLPRRRLILYPRLGGPSAT